MLGFESILVLSKGFIVFDLVDAIFTQVSREERSNSLAICSRCTIVTLSPLFFTTYVELQSIYTSMMLCFYVLV